MCKLYNIKDARKRRAASQTTAQTMLYHQTESESAKAKIEKYLMASVCLEQDI